MLIYQYNNWKHKNTKGVYREILWTYYINKHSQSAIKHSIHKEYSSTLLDHNLNKTDTYYIKYLQY